MALESLNEIAASRSTITTVSLRDETIGDFARNLNQDTPSFNDSSTSFNDLSARVSFGCAIQRFASTSTAGVSLPRASRHTERSGAGGGADGRRHLQAAGEHSTGAARVWSPQWTHLRTHRHTGAHGVPWRLSPTWLSGRRVAAPCRSSSTMPSIDYGPTSWPMPMKFWFRLERARSRPR
jgi:hypothetical protein